MTQSIYRTAAILFSLALFTACSNADEAQVSTATQTSEPGAESTSVVSGTEPTVIYVEATPQEIEAARQGFSENDFAVIADDMMFYRATAIERLEEWRIPFTRLTGRRPIEFIIDGVRQNFDFKDVTTLDFIVVHLPNENPRVFAPIEIEDVRTYWQSAGEQEN